MKKIIVITTLMMMCFAGTAFAGALDSLPNSLVSLSDKVVGTYFSNGTGTTATQFVISTAHAQGNYSYATGSFSTAIYRKTWASTTLASGDYINAAPNSFDVSTAFSGWSEI